MMQEQSRQQYAEEIIRSNFEATFGQKVRRYLEIGHYGIIANPDDRKFAPVSSECIDLFRDGHFYGCISLTQTVAEALAKFLCNRNGFKSKKDFKKNIEILKTRGFIDENIQRNFLDVWKNRDDYHHLNNSVEIQKEKLEGIAKSKIKALAKIEKSIFACSMDNGKIQLTNPKYWDVKDGKTEVFLRHPFVGS